MKPVIAVHDLGRLDYPRAFDAQREHHAAVVASRDAGNPEVGRLLLVEHVPPVITVSRRPDARKHLTATAEMLAAAGVGVCETDRGGDITYHGPGQLVVYPIVDLNTLRLNLHGYMRMLEEVVIAALARFGVVGQSEKGAAGVWVLSEPQAQAPGSSSAKICAMGVRVRRWVTMHGLALNVTTNLEHFGLIVPCGLAGRGVTSLQHELGPRCPSMDEVKRVMVREFERVIAEKMGH